ncbi:MGH1-like glycoside hydrolase domain-containing protein [Ovoidimarina sediminis]|uniref:MGH1-like glycoside hydrolase domain-containing protein n=1 Tax=Ovoidimarina sediminis TaxID=3079856 RepID=UPI002914C9FE|nr:hypothetical protein [Rhodophyticola sp. MJ-SS7]MDU8946048.1 hypothetical protein [Rhodophyticola sp. MJ-SS7]
MSAQDHIPLDDQARAILRGNDRGGYTMPTAGLYPYQWNWDSAFAAWGFSSFDIERAWRELETLFSGQWDTGMVPHILFHQDDPGYFPGPSVWGTEGMGPIPSSGISQPPVAATLSRWIYEADPEAGRERLAALYPKMVDWHRWFDRWRVVDGMVAVTHPWESGRDNCPDWDMGMANVDGSKVGAYERRDLGHVDAAMRPGKADYDRYLAILQFGKACNWDDQTIYDDGPFLIADPGMHFILLRANDDLAAIGRELGLDTGEVEDMAATLRAGAEGLWNPSLGAYDARDLRTARFADNLSSAAFLAYYARVEHEGLEERLLKAWNGVRYGIPSADPEASGFEPRRYWRGPSWPVVNALIARGLTETGRTGLAERLRCETEELIRSGGFYEYFDPTDGHPAGGANFTWTAAVWLAWASPSAGQD